MEKREEKKGTSLCFKGEEKEEDKEKEVFQDEIKTVFVFIRQKVVYYKKQKKNPNDQK